MKRSILLAVALIFPLLANLPAQAIQCARYARLASGIAIRDDAWRWWHAASGHYVRGRTPRPGAVLVFARQGHMRRGHVSVVRRIVGDRMILVDHANWAPAAGPGRGMVARGVPVIDVSPRNDWTEVRVWYRPIGQFGNGRYRTLGFIYSDPAPLAARRAFAHRRRRAPSPAAHLADQSRRPSAALIHISDLPLHHRDPLSVRLAHLWESDPWGRATGGPAPEPLNGWD